MQPSYFKTKIWHKGDPRSGFLHQVVIFEIPGSDHKMAKTKYAEIYAVPGLSTTIVRCLAGPAADALLQTHPQ